MNKLVQVSRSAIFILWLATGCSQHRSAGTHSTDASKALVSSALSAAPSAPAGESDPADKFYRASRVYVLGPGYDLCQEMPGMPSGLWGNSRRVETQETAASGVLTAHGRYADNGQTATYLGFLDLKECQAAASSGSMGVAVERNPAVKPFQIVSANSGEVITSSELAKQMCRQPGFDWSTHLLRNFPVVATGGDDSMALLTFRGDQQGNEVKVVIAMEHRPLSRMAYVYVGDETALSCR